MTEEEVFDVEYVEDIPIAITEYLQQKHEDPNIIVYCNFFYVDEVSASGTLILSMPHEVINSYNSSREILHPFVACGNCEVGLGPIGIVVHEHHILVAIDNYPNIKYNQMRKAAEKKASKDNDETVAKEVKYRFSKNPDIDAMVEKRISITQLRDYYNKVLFTLNKALDDEIGIARDKIEEVVRVEIQDDLEKNIEKERKKAKEEWKEWKKKSLG